MDPSPLCARCGESLGMESARAAEMARYPTAVCPMCAEAPPQFLSAHACGIYGGTLRELIHLLKYDLVRPIAKPLGRMLAETIAGSLPPDAAAYTLVAVPLFRRKRPFNQSALLMQEALPSLRASRADCRFHTHPNLLMRTRSTGSQFSLSPEQRRKNVRGAFSATGEVSGLSVILIDDVYTTGATAAECTRVLLLAGATSVRVVTLARAQRETAVRWNPTTPSFDGNLSAESLFPLFPDRH